MNSEQQLELLKFASYTPFAHGPKLDIQVEIAAPVH